MAQYVEYILVDGEHKQIDYNGLANKPEIQAPLSDNDSGYGQRIKAIEDALAEAIDFETQNY